jgi:hypothetical protein
MHEHTHKDTDLSSKSLVTLDFHGNSLVTFQHDGEPFVAMRSVCEGMGLDWASQYVKLKNSPVLMCCDITTHDSIGRKQSMSALPVRKLPLWLASVNPNKIKDEEKRQRIVLYQEESAIALHDYWTQGVAVKGDLDGIVTGLSPEVAKSIGGIVKGIVMKALGEGIEQMIDQRLARDPRMGAVTAIPAIEVAIDRGVKRRPRGFVLRVSNALTRFCEGKADYVIHRDVYGRKLFPRQAINEWLAKGGWGPLSDALDLKGGQSVMRLVPKGGDK